uniref:Reverse transcriptase domain-containing protein n=1 Tax=Tanacetum cinerariifolium TaxID=118510 RepID=A0A6L2P6X6_TANCI|nr:reverse transcriptase domain-containing protein [Tanacetum cinerariifolium]
MHGHGHPELAKKLNDKIPKTVDKMFERVKAFIKGEVAIGSAEMVRPYQGDKEYVRPAWSEVPEKARNKGGPREARRNMGVYTPYPIKDTFTLLIKTLKKILSMESVSFPEPPPLIRTPEKQNLNKFCDYHGDRGKKRYEGHKHDKGRRKSQETFRRRKKGTKIVEGGAVVPTRRANVQDKETSNLKNKKLLRKKDDGKALSQSKRAKRKNTLGGSCNKRKSNHNLIHEVKETLRKLKRVNIKIDPIMSSFGVKEGKFLSHMVTEEGIRVDPERIKAITLSPTPRSPNQIRSLFLQLTTISKFIPKLVGLKHPIREARTRMETAKESGWTNEVEEALRRIKRKLGKLYCTDELSDLYTVCQKVLSYDESKSKKVSEHEFMTFFRQDKETSTSTMFLYYFLDYDSEMTKKLFAGYTGIKVKQFRETQLLHMGNVKKSVVERTRHKRQYARRMKERQVQSRESKVVSSKALDASLVVTECSGTKSDEHITSSSSGTHIIQVVDADITPVNDQVPSTKVHLISPHNVLDNEQQHIDQSESSYDTYLLEKGDSNSTHDLTNMSHRGGEID